ncbi:MAG: inositol monophosphatase family protein [Candidatus Competibacterales bacterium]
MHPTATIAKRAALGAGRIILRYYDRLDQVQVSAKGKSDLVRDLDLQAEQEIIHTIRRAYPDHAIVAEESSPTGAPGRGANSEDQWIIDPLDGTTNYLHRFPQFAVSIAFKSRGRLEMGLVYDPLRQELFLASRGRGALLNDRRIRVSNPVGVDTALVGTGFPARCPEHLPAYLAMFAAVLDQCSEIRRAGSAALDLAFVAAGRLDGFWEIGLKPWDIAAGVLLIQEAGGMVGDFQGQHAYFQSGHLVAGGAKVYRALLQAIAPHLTPALGGGLQ